MARKLSWLLLFHPDQLPTQTITVFQMNFIRNSGVDGQTQNRQTQDKPLPILRHDFPPFEKTSLNSIIVF